MQEHVCLSGCVQVTRELNVLCALDLRVHHSLVRSRALSFDHEHERARLSSACVEHITTPAHYHNTPPPDLFLCNCISAPCLCPCVSGCVIYVICSGAAAAAESAWNLRYSLFHCIKHQGLTISGEGSSLSVCLLSEPSPCQHLLPDALSLSLTLFVSMP